MIKSDICQRYAKALFNLFKTPEMRLNQLDRLQFFSELARSKPDAVNRLAAPYLSVEQRKQLWQAVFGNTLDQQLINYCLLLIQKGHFSMLPAISQQYRHLVNQESNCLEGELLTAIPLKTTSKETLMKHLKKTLRAKELHLTEKIDPKLLAGGIVRLETQQIDFSGKGTIAKLKSQLLALRV